MDNKYCNVVKVGIYTQAVCRDYTELCRFLKEILPNHEIKKTIIETWRFSTIVGVSSAVDWIKINIIPNGDWDGKVNIFGLDYMVES